MYVLEYTCTLVLALALVLVLLSRLLCTAGTGADEDDADWIAILNRPISHAHACVFPRWVRCSSRDGAVMCRHVCAASEVQ